MNGEQLYQALGKLTPEDRQRPVLTDDAYYTFKGIWLDDYEDDHGSHPAILVDMIEWDDDEDDEEDDGDEDDEEDDGDEDDEEDDGDEDRPLLTGQYPRRDGATEALHD
jgi:hypothetical protein